MYVVSEKDTETRRASYPGPTSECGKMNLRSVSLWLFSLPGRLSRQKGREAVAMGAAPRKSRAAIQLACRATDTTVPASMEFVVVEDNSGAYHWRLRSGDDATLAQSDRFASYDDAERAARLVRAGAASARFEARVVEAVPIDLVARREAPNDDSDAERWLDESGSFSEAVTEWSQPR